MLEAVLHGRGVETGLQDSGLNAKVEEGMRSIVKRDLPYTKRIREVADVVYHMVDTRAR
jgi:hypothetical protein